MRFQTIFSVMVLVLVGASLVLGTTETNTTNKPASFRMVHGLVLGVDGKPAANRIVTLRGISRAEAAMSEDIPGYQEYWKFKTDQAGCFSVRLASAEMDDSAKRIPVPGIYALVVLPQGNDAGAVSPALRSIDDSEESPSNEWGKTLDIGPDGLDLTLKIQKGVTVKGQILDYEIPHRPLNGIRVTCEHDLHADTHTGAGGEIFKKSTTTGKNGAFTFTHVYPAACVIRIEPTSTAFGYYACWWLKTKHGDQWDDEVDFHILPEDKKNQTIGIMAARRPLFRCWGHVQDQEGHPIADAAVTLSEQSESNQSRWTGFGIITTQADHEGNYEIELGTPWIEFISAVAKGFKGANIDSSEISPGKHDFVLEKLAKNKTYTGFLNNRL
jgi:hypothetical protein